MRSCSKSRKLRDKRKKVEEINPSPSYKYNYVNIKEHALVIFCNPLLDMSADVSLELLQSYNINSLDVLEAKEEHMPIFEELLKMRKPAAKLLAGGSGLVTARILQHMVKKPNVVSFFGAVGKDENSEKLRKLLTKSGVNLCLQEQPDEPTGVCASLRTGAHHALISNVGAAKLFNEDFFDDPTNKGILLEAEVLYLTFYFLTLHPLISEKIVAVATENNRIVAFNLSASYIVNAFYELANGLMPSIDIVFCNETEAEAFATVNEWDTKDIKLIAQTMQAMPKISMHPRIVVITREAKPIIVATQFWVQEYPVRKLKRDEIVDSCGCGEAFVSGFLTQYLQKMPLALCIRTGIWAATTILQRVGASLDKFPDYYKSCK